MLLTSLLDRFPLMAKMALKWPLLVRKASRQSSRVTNTPAHTSSQLPRHLAQNAGPCSPALPTRGPYSPLPTVPHSPGHPSFPGVHQTPAHLRPLCWLFLPNCSPPHSGGEELFFTLRVSAKMSPPPRFPISQLRASCHSQPWLNYLYSL